MQCDIIYILYKSPIPRASQKKVFRIFRVGQLSPQSAWKWSRHCKLFNMTEKRANTPSTRLVQSNVKIRHTVRRREVHFISEPKHKHQIKCNSKLNPSICVNSKLSCSLDLTPLGTFRESWFSRVCGRAVGLSWPRCSQKTLWKDSPFHTHNEWSPWCFDGAIDTQTQG